MALPSAAIMNVFVKAKFG